MQLTRQADYALRAIDLLSRSSDGRPQSINQIADQGAIPREFLAKILKRLTEEGFLLSKLGVTGGYVLARRPKEISYRAVIEALEGPIHLSLCTESPKRDCPAHDPGGLHDFWVKLEARFLIVLNRKHFRSRPLAPKARQRDTARRRWQPS